MDLVIQCVTKQYANFSGRACRKEFWSYFITYAILLVLSFFIDYYFDLMISYSGYGVISLLFILILALPTIAVSIRRLHDTNRRGWWCLLFSVPFIGIIILWGFLFQRYRRRK